MQEDLERSKETGMCLFNLYWLKLSEAKAGDRVKAEDIWRTYQLIKE